MIIMNGYSTVINVQESRINIDELKSQFEVGTICGVNVKPIDTYMERKKEYTTWGLFVHVKMENDDQYDLIWYLYNTYENKHGIPAAKSIISVPTTHISKKFNGRRMIEITRYPDLPAILKGCGVNEWVELIGTKIKITPIKIREKNPFIADSITFIPMHDDNPKVIYRPNFFELHTSSDELRKYVEGCAIVAGTKIGGKVDLISPLF